MINEVLVLKTGSDNVGLHVIDEWADELSQYLNIPVKADIIESI